MNHSYFLRIAPILLLVPVALADCGGSDYSEINAPERLHDAGGAGGASGDASDVRADNSGPTPGCPPVEPIPGRNCPAPMLVCTYGDRLCVCSSGLPWWCFDVADAGSTPDGSGGAGGRGGSSVDSGSDIRPPDGSAGRADGGGGSTVDVRVDTGRDTGRGGGAGTGGTGGTGGGAGRGGGAGAAGRDGGARDVAVRDSAGDARDGARDGSTDTTVDTTAEDGPATDVTVDDGGRDSRAPDDGADEAGLDSGDEAG